MSGPCLFDWLETAKPPPMPHAPFQRHSATSAEAAAKIEKRIGPMHRRILELLAKYPGGLTDDAMQTLLEMNPSTQRPRRIELASYGRIVPTDTTQLTRSGRAAQVWKLAGANHDIQEHQRTP